MYKGKNIEANARAPLPAEFRQACREGIACGLATIRGVEFQDGIHRDFSMGLLPRNATISGIEMDGLFQATRPFIQSQYDQFPAKTRGNSQRHTGGGKGERGTNSLARIKIKTQTGAAWNTEESWRKNQRHQASEKSDEIVSSASNTRCRRRIKSRCAKTRTNNNALLAKLRQRGNVKPFSGGNVILQEIAYNDSSTANVNSYSGFELINIQQNSPISSAQYAICQYAAAITMSGLEMLQNSGEEAFIDLMEGRIDVAEGQLVNRIASDVYGDGTGNGGKNITGLGAAVPDVPTSGTYGGISRSSFSFWQPKKYSGVTNGGAAVSAVNIQAYMTALAIQLVRGPDKADTIVADNTYFSYYVNSLQAQQRVTSDDGSATAGAGFAKLKFYGGGMSADVVLDGGVYTGGDSIGSWTGATSAHMWFLNTKYLFLRPHKDRNFVPIGGERQAVNQDAVVKLLGWAGNLTTSNSFLQGVLIA